MNENLLKIDTFIAYNDAIVDIVHLKNLIIEMQDGEELDGDSREIVKVKATLKALKSIFKKADLDEMNERLVEWGDKANGMIELDDDSDSK